MIFISAVINFDIYNRLVKNNPHNQGATFVAYDNNIENKHISTRYNEFLDSYDYSKPEWFVFCHDDWEAKENIYKKLENISKNCLYGPIGRHYSRLLGQITHSAKDGVNDKEKIGAYCSSLKKVMTFDCQCLIVHSSLIKKHNLRFDENLSFDLYVEDFCINAKENFGIKSYVLQLDCHHYSRGNIQPRFFEQAKYLQDKHKVAKGYYFSIVADYAIGNKRKAFIYNTIEGIKRFFYQNKVTKSGKRVIKICKIPVYSRREK